MPEYYDRDENGRYASGMGEWVNQQLSTPIFLPNGTPVSPPTSTKPGRLGSGRSSTEKV